jgi:hypothetical protein
VSKEKPPPKVSEVATGQFKTEGVLLPPEKRQSFHNDLLTKARSELSYLGPERPGDPFQVIFHEVKGSSPDYCVIELKVPYYHGLCFHDKNGPLAYRAALQQTSQNVESLKEIQPTDWVKQFTHQSSDEVKSFVNMMKLF